MIARHVRRIVSVLTAGLALAIVARPTPAQAQLRVYLDRDGDGEYRIVGSYPVSYERALTEFARVGGAPRTEADSFLSAKAVPGVAFGVPQSWEGFVAFLQQTYPSMPLTNQDCDNTVRVIRASIVWTCDGLPCAPADQCTGFFAAATARFRCIAGGDPPCPALKRDCLPNGNPINITAFNTVGGTACVCDPGGNCVMGPGVPNGNGIMFDNNVCDCFRSIGVFVVKINGNPVGRLYVYRLAGQLVAVVDPNAQSRPPCGPSPVQVVGPGMYQFMCNQTPFHIVRQGNQFLWVAGPFSGTLCPVT